VFSHCVPGTGHARVTCTYIHTGSSLPLRWCDGLAQVDSWSFREEGVRSFGGICTHRACRGDDDEKCTVRVLPGVPPLSQLQKLERKDNACPPFPESPSPSIYLILTQHATTTSWDSQTQLCLLATGQHNHFIPFPSLISSCFLILPSLQHCAA